MINQRLATVFGGTGFLGRRAVRQFAEAGFRVRIAARHPDDVEFAEPQTALERNCVDIQDDAAVAAAVEGATAVVNAVSLYVESGDLTFQAVHVDGAERVAAACRSAGVDALIHISGIGADDESESALIRSKAQGERVVRTAFPPAVIFRPSVMFGPDDAFLSGLEAATRPPVVPLFGRGEMHLQPAYVDDVARACALAAADETHYGKVFELGGSRIVTYREAVEHVCDVLGRMRLLVPFPLELWRVVIGAMKILPNPPLTRDQLHLLAVDNTVSAAAAGFSELGMRPNSILELMEDCLRR